VPPKTKEMHPPTRSGEKGVGAKKTGLNINEAPCGVSRKGLRGEMARRGNISKEIFAAGSHEFRKEKRSGLGIE